MFDIGALADLPDNAKEQIQNKLNNSMLPFYDSYKSGKFAAPPPNILGLVWSKLWSIQTALVSIDHFGQYIDITYIGIEITTSKDESYTQSLPKSIGPQG